MAGNTVDLTKFNIDAPQWDQSTFMGRLKHFFKITDPRTVIVSNSNLDKAKDLVVRCRAGTLPPGTTREQLLYAKQLYDSAFHPDSGERMNLIGRMSFQVPGGMAITGFMLQFYRTVPAVVFWQWVNQSFNALVNYTNRNAASPISAKQLGVAYLTATSTALATAVGLNLYTKRAPPLLARWVPFVAVAAANCVNIPMMRQHWQLIPHSHHSLREVVPCNMPPEVKFKDDTIGKREIISGIAVTDENENKLGKSRIAAVKGITQVVISRVTMAAPGMIILPILMERLEKYPFMQRIKFLHAPLQVMLVGCFLIFMVPAACSLFPQRCCMATSKLEPELRDSINTKYGDKVKCIYFNKGL
ncbi:sideroflexin-2 isoform X2 [Narcine bancroftii]|uniref:sideroflexin-2 isoform X2 n=1 Tax=Narcine bancroftii TaxID=1343680 RepID=UPI0038321004